MLHLKVPNKEKGQGPRLAISDRGIVIAEDSGNDRTITHVMIFGINYTVDSNFEETAKEFGIELPTKGAAAA